MTETMTPMKYDRIPRLKYDRIPRRRLHQYLVYKNSVRGDAAKPIAIVYARTYAQAVAKASKVYRLRSYQYYHAVAISRARKSDICAVRRENLYGAKNKVIE